MLRRFPVPQHVFSSASTPSILTAHKLLVGMFLKAVSLNNLSKQLMYLKKLYSPQVFQGSALETIRADCLHLMFQNLLKRPQFLNVYDIEDILTRVQVDARLEPQMALCLLYAYDNWINRSVKEPSKLRRLAVALYVHEKIIGVVDNPEVLKTIEHDPLALDTFNSIELQLSQTRTKTNTIILPKPAPVPESPGLTQEQLRLLDIETYKKQGLLSFHKMLQYIGSPVKNIRMPIDEYLDSLSSEEKKNFLEDYNRFLEIKQRNMELNAANMTIYILEPASNFTKFTDVAIQSDVIKWTQLVESHLDQIPENHQSEEDRILYKFYDYLTLVGLHFLASITVHTLLAETLNLESDTVPLVNILTILERRFKHAVRCTTNVQLPLSQKDYLSIFASIIKVLIDDCLVSVDHIKQDHFVDFKDFRHHSKESYYAFEHVMLRNGAKTTGAIKVNPYLLYKFRAFALYGDADLFHFPMVCPPKPWVSPRVGGFLTDAKPLVVTKYDDDYTDYLDQLLKTHQLDFIYENLDYINSMTWLVNRPVLRVMSKVIGSGEEFLDIPSVASLLNSSSKNRKEKLILKALKSRRDKYEQIVRVAKAYINNIVYFSHQLDFRGRIYPLVSALSYYDEDPARGLLVFAEAKPLGDTGYKWIKYQLAGLYGEDKLSMHQRLEFVDANLDKIIDSAQNPLEETWWQQAENPWQTLALCFEMDKIETFRKTNKVQNYKCRIPVHMDGSCNGLQHYAGLGKDVYGGKYVNLLPSRTKQDVYLEILELVKQKLDPSNPLDVMIQKFISRKIVKRPVMTFVYGVTRYGASNHIHEELTDIKPGEHGLTPEEFDFLQNRTFAVGNRIAELIFASINDLFTSAIRIQHWLQENCLRILLSIGSGELHSEIDFLNHQNFKPFMWTSPSGFPVLQLYTHMEKTRVNTPLQSVSLSTSLSKARADIRKQMNGIAANFIHSLDAVHMFLTCYSCKQDGVPFVAVHDSFWTLPCHVEELSSRLRTEFINLHSQDIVGNLYQDLTDSVRNLYQLVFVENRTSVDFVAKVQEFRRKRWLYKNINKILNEEIRDQEVLAFHGDLIETYKPELFIKRNTKLVSLNDSSISHTFRSSKYTPVITRVVLKKPPSSGDLDIREVARAPFFFS